MKKALTIVLAAMMLLSLSACVKDNTDFEQAQENFENMNEADNKKDIEANIKSVFGVKVDLPDAEEYMGTTVEGSGSSIYMVTLIGTDLTADELFKKLKSSFSGWDAAEASLTYSKQTEKIMYGAVIAKEGDYLTIAFSMTDMELIDGFVDGPSEFYARIKELSGQKIDFSGIVTSIGFASDGNDGAKAYYGGMLLNGSSNLDEAGFEAAAAALDSQLKGFTKKEIEPESWGAKRIIHWVNNNDESQYFELELFDMEGAQYVDFSFRYTDRSLLPEWPSNQIDKFYGKSVDIPAYNGNYRALEVSEYYSDPNDPYSESEDSIYVSMTGCEEEEYNAWLSTLEQNGFLKQTEWNDDIYYKDLGNGLFLRLNPNFETYGGSVELSFKKEKLENLEWPADFIKNTYGTEFAAMFPTMAEATRRTFKVEGNTIYIQNNYNADLFNKFCTDMVNGGFVETSKNDENGKYTYTFDNYDVVKVSVYNYGDHGTIYVDYDKYEGPGFSLPTNVMIEYSFGYANNPDNAVTYKVVKIGEDYYFNSGMSTAYYKYDASTKLWTMYTGFTLNGTTIWQKSDKTLDRFAVDTKLKNSMGNLYFTKTSYIKEDATQTKTVCGKSCIAYVSATGGSSIYWVNQETGLLFAQSTVFATEVTSYKTNVSSMADAGVTADMLPKD